MTRSAFLIPLILLLAACPSRRLLRLENRLLQEENATLSEQLQTLEKRAPPGKDWTDEMSLELVHEWLDRAGYKHTYSGPDAKHVHLEFIGLNTEFSVNVQLFAEADVLFLATGDYLQLSDAQDTDSVTLLLVQIASLNYELLVGKFQLDPETGDVLLSSELLLDDGLGYDTFVRALEQLLHTADGRYPDLERAASGTGL